MTVHPLRPATRRRLGRPLPHQQADRPRAHPQPLQTLSTTPPTMWSYPVLDPVSQAYPGVEGRSPTCYSPVRHSSTSASTGLSVRLACVKHAASVHPEPGSNSPQKIRKKRAVKSPKPDKQKTDKKNSKVQNNALQATCHRQKPSFGPKAQGGQPPPAHTNTTSRHTTQAVPADKPQETHHKKYINTLSSSHTTQTR